MKVKEFLNIMSDIIFTHEFNTLWNASYNTTLIIDIEHNHVFHAVNYVKNYDIEDKDNYCHMIMPFEKHYYKGYEYKDNETIEKMYNVLDDFEVHRWNLTELNHKDRIWILQIETKQT